MECELHGCPPMSAVLCSLRYPLRSSLVYKTLFLRNMQLKTGVLTTVSSLFLRNVGTCTREHGTRERRARVLGNSRVHVY